MCRERLKVSDQLDLLDGGGRVTDVSIVARMEQAFLEYSMSVIVGRALPDVRDGLKPVQRRILYSMWETNLRPDRPYRKCASAVGEVMKKYHPHGDTSIYDALVRMAQEFSTREPLIDGHGNFGSIDGDPPAAMRYTECRLSPLAMELLRGIDEDTVDEVDNYDGYETEPVVLPARFPNLLVNGATGIAVGMATNIAPHNLGELVDACLLLIDRPDADLDDVMKVVPAPDFPTGARIVETEGIREAFETGRGAVTVESVATTEVRTGNLPRIVVTEIPFLVNKASLLERIAGLVQDRKVDGVRDLRDESSRDGMRIVIELKRGEDPAAVLEQLMRSTDLRSNFNVNQVALVDGAPRTLGLLETLHHYLAHQREVLTHRTTHRLAQARARAHVLEGLLTALDHLDEVIALIRRSQTATEARESLMARFELSEVQARAVLEMRLRRLAALERAELEDEYQQLQELLAELEAILADPQVLDDVLRTELRDLRETHATPRRSRIVAEGISVQDALTGGSAAGFAAREVTATVSRGGYVKPLATRRRTPTHKHVSDPLAAVVRSDTDHGLLLVTDAGVGHRVDLGELTVVPPRQRGAPPSQLLADPLDGEVVGAVPLLADPAGWTLVTVSDQGTVKRTELAEYTDARVRTIETAGTRDGEHLVAATLCRDDDDLLLASAAGQVVRLATSQVRTMGRTASGVAGMNVDGSRVVAVSRVPGGGDDGLVLTLGADGAGKTAVTAEYPRQGRGGKGVITGTDDLVWCGMATDLHVAGDEGWTVLRAEDVPQRSRSAAGDAVLDGAHRPAVGELDAMLLRGE